MWLILLGVLASGNFYLSFGLYLLYWMHATSKRCFVSKIFFSDLSSDDIIREVKVLPPLLLIAFYYGNLSWYLIASFVLGANATFVKSQRFIMNSVLEWINLTSLEYYLSFSWSQYMRHTIGRQCHGHLLLLNVIRSLCLCVYGWYACPQFYIKVFLALDGVVVLAFFDAHKPTARPLLVMNPSLDISPM